MFYLILFFFSNSPTIAKPRVCDSEHQIRHCSPVIVHWESASQETKKLVKVDFYFFTRIFAKIYTSLTTVKKDEQGIPVLQHPLNLYLGVI